MPKRRHDVAPYLILIYEIDATHTRKLIAQIDAYTAAIAEALFDEIGPHHDVVQVWAQNADTYRQF